MFKSVDCFLSEWHYLPTAKREVDLLSGPCPGNPPTKTNYPTLKTDIHLRVRREEVEHFYDEANVSRAGVHS